jgi:hypothetical protein
MALSKYCAMIAMVQGFSKRPTVAWSHVWLAKEQDGFGLHYDIMEG